MQFEYPVMLFLMLALPAVLVKPHGKAEAVNFPGISDFVSTHQGLRQRCLLYLPWLRVASLAILVLAMASPKMSPAEIQKRSEGIAIEIVVDRSASMSNSDMLSNGVEMSRLDAVKRISRDFVFGDGRSLAGRPNDLIGLIGFAAEPVSLCPLTLSHDTLRSAIDKLQTPTTLVEDGTAIGDALALAAGRLHSLVGASKVPIAAKLIVLITDGENNLGARTPRQAAQLAREWGVSICAITIRPDSRDAQYEQQISDEMQALAGSTHGIARTAKDGSALRAIYEEIDRMDPAHLEQVQGNDRDRVFLWTILAAFLLMTLEFALRETWLRKVPA